MVSSSCDMMHGMTNQDDLSVERGFPRTYREFVHDFPSDDACAGYLEQMRWSAGFCCPACQTSCAPWRQTRGRLVCTACRHQTSVTAGTILEKTRTPLNTWFEAAIPAHLQSYLEEFTFRFNRRNSRSRGLVFRRLLEQAMVTGPVTEANVTFGYDWSHK